MEGVRARLGLGCGAPARIWEEFVGGGGWRNYTRQVKIGDRAAKD
jgi:hypothetical protein